MRASRILVRAGRRLGASNSMRHEDIHRHPNPRLRRFRRDRGRKRFAADSQGTYVVGLHPRSVRGVLAVAEGRRPVHRRSSRGGRVPDCRGAGAACRHVELDRRALLAGARVRGLSGASGGGARRVQASHPCPRGRYGEQSDSALLTLGSSEFETALATDLVNLDESARRIVLDDVSEVSGLIARSERVVLVGVDQMAFFASYLRHLLALLEVRAEVVASASQEALARLARIDEGALVIGFSCGRPHALVLRAVKLARKRDSATVAISDASISELDEAVRPLPLLLVEQPFLHALAHGAAVAHPGARLRRLLGRRGEVRRANPRVQAEIAGDRPVRVRWMRSGLGPP